MCLHACHPNGASTPWLCRIGTLFASLSLLLASPVTTAGQLSGPFSHTSYPPNTMQGPKSLAVLRWFADNGPLVRAVRGNHELLALRSYRQLL